MYRIEDTVSAIKEVQRLLRINESGIYDESTKNAVTNIQRKYNLSETGNVNYETFNAIVKEYRKEASRLNTSNYLFDPVFPYVLDDMDENVALINNAITLVLKDYRYEESLPSGKYLGKNTVDAVNFLQGVFKLPVSHEIDVTFLNRLLLEKKAIETKNKYSK